VLVKRKTQFMFHHMKLHDEDAKIMFVENFQCNSKDGLTVREKYYIKAMNVTTNVSHLQG